MALGIPDAEEKYLKEKVHSSAGYIKYLQKKYGGKKLDEVSGPEWEYYHHLRRKERTTRFKKGTQTLKDIRSTSLLEQEERKKESEYFKLKGIKAPRITPKVTPGQPPFRHKGHYGKYNLRNLSSYEWSQFLKKIKEGPKKGKALVRNLSAEDYLKYLKEKGKAIRSAK